METTLRDIVENYGLQLRRRTEGDDAARPAEFDAYRRAAFDRFAKLGFPTRKDEDWRHTDPRPVTRTAWQPLAAPEVDVPASRLAPYRLDAGNELLLVFVNGQLQPALCDAAALPQGVRVRGLSAALVETPARVLPRLSTAAPHDEHAFVALNAALFADGAYVHVEKNTQVERPIYLLYLTIPDRRGGSVQPRNLVVIDDGASAQVIEHHVGLDNEAYFCNAVTELVVGNNARLEHAKVVRETDAAAHIGTVAIEQQRNSHILAHVLTFGGKLVRNDVRTRLAGEGGNCDLNGLYMLRGSQHADNHLRVEHAVSHCGSREMYRGILDDASRGVFTGRIVVQPGAQKTDAKQTNRNMLLSGSAQADSKPQLEIYADDVKCTHGATIGQIDENALFYLCSRGIDEEAARSLMVYAFAREALEELSSEPLRAQLTELVLSRLPNGDSLRDD